MDIRKCKHSQYNIVIEKSEDSVLLFNTFSGSLIELTVNEYVNFTDYQSGMDDELFQTLYSQGFFVDRNANEFNKVLFFERSLIYRDDTRAFFVIAPTLNCNMNCIYCFEGQKNNCSMTEDTEEKTIAFIENSLNSSPLVKSLKISWFGGEPLLCLESIKRITRRIKNFCAGKGITYSAIVISNGLLLTREVANELVDCNVEKVQITLDGTVEKYCRLKRTTKSVYEKVLKNIDEICDIIDVTIRLNCTQDNRDDIDALINQLSANAKINLYLAPIQNYNDVLDGEEGTALSSVDFLSYKRQMLEKYADTNIVDRAEVTLQPLGISCSLLKTKNYIIGPNGEIYNCEHDLGDKSKIIGDVRSGLYFNDYHMKLMTPSHPEKCRDCEIFPICLSGCQSESTKFGRTEDFCKNKRDSLRTYLVDYYKRRNS